MHVHVESIMFIISWRIVRGLFFESVCSLNKHKRLSKKKEKEKKKEKKNEKRLGSQIQWKESQTMPCSRWYDDLKKKKK